MTFDVSENHVFKKIDNNLNLSSEDPNVFFLLYHDILFLSILVKTYIGTKSIIYVLEKQQYRSII